jgi:hypothetical protein
VVGITATLTPNNVLDNDPARRARLVLQTHESISLTLRPMAEGASTDARGV